jgi:glucosamine--fructose-6-phosphate aminotransferase (isomerizing)
MAHTRWATHGAVTEVNAHPLVADDGGLAIVMNGVIENDLELRRRLAAIDQSCVGDSDTATLLATIQANVKRGGDLATAVAGALAAAEGRLAIVVAASASPSMLVIARRGSPLFVGIAGKSAWVASDPLAFPEAISDVFAVDDGATIAIENGTISAACRHQLTACKRRARALTNALDGHTSYFEQEILAQRDTIGLAVDLALGMEALSDLAERRWRRVLLLGCGSAHIACLAAKASFERWTRLPTDAVLANEAATSEAWIDDGTLVIAVSQSGETADTLLASEALVAQGATLVAVTNAPHGSLSRLARRVCPLGVGQEVSVASTKAYTAMLVRLTLLAAELGMRQRQLPLADFRCVVAAARALPSGVAAALATRDRIASAASRWRERTDFLFMGRGYDHATALEGALKLRELSYRSALGIAAGELKHGSIAVLDSCFPVIALATDTRSRQKTLAAIREVQTRGADVLALTTSDDSDAALIASNAIALPAVRQNGRPSSPRSRCSGWPLAWRPNSAATSIGPVTWPKA